MLLDPFLSTHCVCSASGHIKSHRVARTSAEPINGNLLHWRDILKYRMMTWKHYWCIICLDCCPESSRTQQGRAGRDRERERKGRGTPMAKGSVFTLMRMTQECQFGSGLVETSKSNSLNSPRPFLSRFMLLYPPPPMLSSSRSRHSIVVLNSYEDDPSIVFRSFPLWFITFLRCWGFSLHLTTSLVAGGDELSAHLSFPSLHTLIFNGFLSLFNLKKFFLFTQNWKLKFSFY